MAASVAASNCNSLKYARNLNFGEVLNCSKYVEVELQLKQVLEELNTAQLIIHMLKEESTHDQHGSYSSIEPRNLIQCNQQNAVKTKENK